MKPKNLSLVAAVASAVLFNVAFVSPALAQAKAALTRDIDRSSAQPVYGACQTYADSGGNIKCSLYTVPAGKRLVVESAGYSVSTATGSVVYEILFGPDAGYPNVSLFSPNVHFVAQVLAFELGSTRNFSATQALKIYLDEGQTLVAGTSHGGSANYLEYFKFSGYLVDK